MELKKKDDHVTVSYSIITIKNVGVYFLSNV